MTDVIHLVTSEVSHLQDFLAGLSKDAWSRPSACAGWTVADVVAHLTQGALAWSDLITRAIRGDANPPPGQQFLRPGDRGSEVNAQRAIAFRRGVGEEEQLQAFADGYHRLHQVMLTLRPEDWDKPCFHRRGVMPTHEYVALRLQELTIHGWDIRSAFDERAVLPERPLRMLVGLVPRWLSYTLSHDSGMSAPIRYRFDVPGPAPVRQDVLVSPDSFGIESVADLGADVTFRCNTGNYLLLVYGRLGLGKAVDTGRLEVGGNWEQAVLFNTRFQGI